MQNPYLKTDFPQAILHVDGDGFFAGCEVAKNPSLRGKPVVVGRERGLALAMTYEAKKFGIKRGMKLSEVRKLCPHVILLDMDHESYKLFSGRMNSIIERYTPLIERYSIDESFANITGLRQPLKMSYDEIAYDLKETLKRELGMTFSVGVAPTKVLAKIASNFKKPDGMTVIAGRDIRKFLEHFPIEKVWGIGRQTAAHMNRLNIYTALHFTELSEGYVTDIFAKPQHELWLELRGQKTLQLNKAPAPYKSLMRTRTFSPIFGNKKFLLAELSRHTEVVCARAREHGLSGRVISFFLKTQDFKYQGLSIKLSRYTNIPQEIISVIQGRLGDIFEEDMPYRAAGVTLSELESAATTQLDLFDGAQTILSLKRIYEHVDELNVRYGKTVVHLAGSTNLIKREHVFSKKEREDDLFRLGIPLIGTIS